MAIMKRRKVIACLGLIGVLICVAGFVVIIIFLQTPNANKNIAAWMMHADYLGNEGVLLQTKSSNCGPVVLKMIFDHYDISSSLKEIEQCIELTKEGTSMLELKEMAEIKGLKAEGWCFTLEDFLRSSFPSILYVNEDHYIVADSVSTDGSIYVSDPAIGKLRVSKKNLNKIWKGETLIFYGNKDMNTKVIHNLKKG